MIRFILNDKTIRADDRPGTILLDYLRRHRKMTGTKEVCREGDCGACMVLLGRLAGDALRYKPVNSCLLPLGEADGAHVITIEGLNRPGQSVLTPVQKAYVSQGGVQCGYCTPGMVISTTGFFIDSPTIDEKNAIAALDGNLCRCTGYGGIKRAVRGLCEDFSLPAGTSSKKRLELLARWKILPEYILGMPERLKELQALQDGDSAAKSQNEVLVAGGTDLFVQKGEQLADATLVFLSRRPDLKGIRMENGRCVVGAAVTVAELASSAEMKRMFPRIEEDLKRFGSTPIRNRATVAGNIVNASPIGDLAVFLLALDATVALSDGGNSRSVALKEFYKGYKQLDLRENEMVASLSFPLPDKSTGFHFEKVSKRTYVDIASVNSAMGICVENGVVKKATISAGGVAPVPLVLSETGRFLEEKAVCAETVKKAAAAAQSEISPISDVRGSARYKRLLLGRLVIAHFLALFPERLNAKELV